MRAYAHILLVMMVLTAPVAATAETSTNPIARAKAEIEHNCERVEYPPGFASTRDLTGDGLDDLVISYGVRCDGTASYYCGSAGCLTEIWIAEQPEKWTLALSAHVQGVSPTLYDGAPALKFVNHGGGCGRPGSESHISIRIWDGAVLRTVHENYERHSCTANPNSTGDTQ